MKVLHLIDSGGLYGAERVLLTLAKEQQKQGHTPVILSAGDPYEGEKLLEAEARQLSIPIIQWRMKPGLNFAATKEILWWANEEKFELLHSHGYKFDILLALFRKRLISLRLKFVSTVHGFTAQSTFSKLGFYRLIDWICLFRADGVAVVSSSLLNSFRRHPRVIKIPNGIDELPASQGDPEKSLPLKGLPTEYMISVGRLSPEKGIENLLWAFERFSGRHKHPLLIVGDGPERERLQRIVIERGLEGLVRFTGFVANPSPLIRCAYALVITSKTEGLPLNLLEAMRERTSVISTPVGEIPLVLENSQYGYMSEDVSKESIHHALEKFYLDMEAHHVKVEGAYSKFLADYTSSVMERKYREFYLNACQ